MGSIHEKSSVRPRAQVFELLVECGEQVKVTLSIICILIISLSVQGLRSRIESIDNDNPTLEDIKNLLTDMIEGQNE